MPIPIPRASKPASDAGSEKSKSQPAHQDNSNVLSLAPTASEVADLTNRVNNNSGEDFFDNGGRQTHYQRGEAGNVSHSQLPLSSQEAGRLYEERIEEEYAKREGGA